MLSEPLTGMGIRSENGQSILITSSNGTAQKVQHIVVRDNIKQEYFVSDNPDITIATNNSSMMNNNTVSNKLISEKFKENE